jgi:anti-anti-sigma regulatory factor
VRVGDAVTTICSTGDMDAQDTAAFLAELRQLATVCSGELIVDLAACTEITTTVLADLVAVQSSCASRGCRLTARVGHPHIANPLQLAGIALTNHPAAGPARPSATVLAGTVR